MEKVRKLFSPTALAATVATGLLVTAGVAYAADQISVPAEGGQVTCLAGQTSCSTLLPGYGPVYFCCPSATTCSTRYAEVDPQTGKCWAWCDQAGGGR